MAWRCSRSQLQQVYLIFVVTIAGTSANFCEKSQLLDGTTGECIDMFVIDSAAVQKNETFYRNQTVQLTPSGISMSTIGPRNLPYIDLSYGPPAHGIQIDQPSDGFYFTNTSWSMSVWLTFSAAPANGSHYNYTLFTTDTGDKIIYQTREMLCGVGCIRFNINLVITGPSLQHTIPLWINLTTPLAGAWRVFTISYNIENSGLSFRSNGGQRQFVTLPSQPVMGYLLGVGSLVRTENTFAGFITARFLSKFLVSEEAAAFQSCEVLNTTTQCIQCGGLYRDDSCLSIVTPRCGYGYLLNHTTFVCQLGEACELVGDEPVSRRLFGSKEFLMAVPRTTVTGCTMELAGFEVLYSGACSVALVMWERVMNSSTFSNLFISPILDFPSAPTPDSRLIRHYFTSTDMVIIQSSQTVLFGLQNTDGTCDMRGRQRQPQVSYYSKGLAPAVNDNVTLSLQTDFEISFRVILRDVDECNIAGMDNCSLYDNTHCANIHAAYVCVCDTGFESRNLSLAFASDCTDIDECQLGSLANENCSLYNHTHCQNTLGAFTCLCDEGFERNGPSGGFASHCVDVDECHASHNCSSYNHTHCVNRMHGYACVCDDGFETLPSLAGFAALCNDTDECLPGQHNCTAQQTCLNNLGGYICIDITTTSSTITSTTTSASVVVTARQTTPASLQQLTQTRSASPRTTSSMSPVQSSTASSSLTAVSMATTSSNGGGTDKEGSDFEYTVRVAIGSSIAGVLVLGIVITIICICYLRSSVSSMGKGSGEFTVASDDTVQTGKAYGGGAGVEIEMTKTKGRTISTTVLMNSQNEYTNDYADSAETEEDPRYRVLETVLHEMPEVGSDGYLVNSALQAVSTADGYVVDDRAANGDGINPNLKDSSSRKLPQQPSIEYDEPLDDSDTLPQTSATASASASRQLSTISIAGQAGAGHDEGLASPVQEPPSDIEGLYSCLRASRYQQLARDDVQLGKEIGSGEFGVVMKGTLRSESAEVVPVAVKVLKDHSVESRRAMLQEAALMGQFDHKNIVRLCGVVTRNEPVLVVLELMAGGDLRSHLMCLLADSGGVDYKDIMESLYKHSREIAKGMAYLESRQFVHRDLAARNVMLDGNKVCKIGDFGMSRNLASETYYQSHGGKVPFKWTAPEALLFRKYSTASDVWSYGVVLFEIYSLGQKPYVGKTADKVIKILEDEKRRQSPPPGCPRAMYKLMIDCWHPNNRDRPRFSHIVKRLKNCSEEAVLLPAVSDGVQASQIKLGSSIQNGEDLYIDLQNAYVT